MPKPGHHTPDEIRDLIKAMPKTTEILKMAIHKLGYDDKDQDWFRNNFSEAIIELMEMGRILLVKEQKVVRAKVIKMWQDSNNEDDGDFLLVEGIKSLRNQMMKRAGVHMERCIEWLLNRCGIANENGRSVTGRSDRVCPSIEVYTNHPERSVILEYKRTIRERWKEVRDEIARSGRNVWLLTLDDYLNDDLVKMITDGNIIIYAVDEVYNKLERIPGKLRSLDNFINDLLHVVGTDS